MQAAIERGVRDAGVRVGRRGDVHEVDPTRLGLQHLQVVAVDARLGEVPLGCGTPGLVAVDYRHYLEVTGADASFGVDGCVSLSSNEAVTDKGAT